MSDDEFSSDDRSESVDPDDDRFTELRLEVGLQPVTGLLDSLLGLGASTGSPVPGESVDWTTVDDRADGDAGDEGLRDDSSGPSQSRRVEEIADGEYLLDTRYDGDEFVVTMDIPGATEEDLTVGLDRESNRLVIQKDDTELERIELPWNDVEPGRVLFNNGVLEARMRPAES